MIAVDTNLLVYAHRTDSTWHLAAREALDELIRERPLWAIPWPCVHEFLAVVTHPKIFNPPTPASMATTQLGALVAAPNVVLLGETGDYWSVLKNLLRREGVVGPKIHDAKIAALCLHHGVQELWTADRDFSLFPMLKKRNPLAAET